MSLALVVLAALSAGCASGARPTPTPTPRVSSGVPVLAFDKRQVDLGTVTRDQQGAATFLVMNRGDRPLQVGPVTVQVEQGGEIAESVKENVHVGPGEVFLLPIKLGDHPQLGPYHLLVNVASNDPATPTATLSVDFNVVEAPPPPGTGPRLRVDKEMIDIGPVPYDWPLYEVFTLRNDGDAPLVLQGKPVVRVEEGC